MIQQWKYESTPRFGGDKLELESLSPNNVIVSPVRKTVHLGIRGPKEKSVLYFPLNDELQSSTGQLLWDGEAWYTLNSIPID